MSNTSTSLEYGSAKLTGFLWKDYTCLQPLNLGKDSSNLTNATFLAHITDKAAYDYTMQKEKAYLKDAYKFYTSNRS